MDIASILLASILVGGFIAIATGVAAILGMLQIASGGGLRHLPPETSASIIARQRAIDARLRARYLQRQRMARQEAVSPGAQQIEELVDQQTEGPAAALVPSEQGGTIGPLAERVAG
jgi:hypothetical protein